MVFTGRTSILLSWPGLSPAVLGCHQPGQILRCCGCRPYYCLKAEDLIFAISHIHLGASYAALRLRSNNFLISSLWSPAANCHTPLVLGIVITVQVWSPNDLDVIHEELEKNRGNCRNPSIDLHFQRLLEVRKERKALRMAGASSSQVTIAQKTWEMSNNIMEVIIVLSLSQYWDMSDNIMEVWKTSVKPCLV